MHTSTKFMALIFLSIFITQSAWAGRDVREAMVKIYATNNRYIYSVPWQVSYQENSSGSGCIIEGERILTNAHVVRDQVFIQVRRSGMAKKYTAKVEIMAHECDLALLRVDDASFFSGVNPPKIGALPEVRDKVAVYGFPKGGDKLSITEGVVSRVEHTEYTHSTAYLLACQIDAAINPGNSGGPVIKDNRIVGVAFQARAGQSIGYMVPAPTIVHFLEDIKDGEYSGIPELGVSCQTMGNRDIRVRFGMGQTKTGILVNRIHPDSPARGKLKTGDIILAVDGQNVENDGTIELRKGERTSWEHAIQVKHLHDRVRLDILRANRITDVDLALSLNSSQGRLVPQQYDMAPTYYILAGLVFEPLTVNYLRGWGKEWRMKAPANLLNYYLYGEPTDDRREVVVLARVLADEINTGYIKFEDKVISHVNGKRVGNMQDLVETIDEFEGNYYVITDERGHRIVLDRHRASSHGHELLKKYCINSDRSKDLKRFAETYASGLP